MEQIPYWLAEEQDDRALFDKLRAVGVYDVRVEDLTAGGLTSIQTRLYTLRGSLNARYVVSEQPNRRARRIVEFYQILGNNHWCASFFPQLLAYSCQGKTYKLVYEYFDGGVPAPEYKVNSKAFQMSLVDCLNAMSKIRRRDALSKRAGVTYEYLPYFQARDPTRSGAEGYAELLSEARSESLNIVERDVCKVRERWLSLPKVLSHGDLQRRNILVSSKDEIRIIDADCWGFYPVGFDLGRLYQMEFSTDAPRMVGVSLARKMGDDASQREMWLGVFLSAYLLNRMLLQKRVGSQKYRQFCRKLLKSQVHIANALVASSYVEFP